MNIEMQHVAIIHSFIWLLGLGCIWFGARKTVSNITERKQADDKLRNQRDLLALQKEELETTLARVKQLEGIIPICMYCKKIRDNQNTWNQLEEYITEHSGALFSHGMCPECLERQMKMIKN